MMLRWRHVVGGFRALGPRTRSGLGLALAMPLALVILGILACLPVPLGDPEQSKVDPKLAGAWIEGDGAAGAETGDQVLYIIRPFDARTYLIEGLRYELKDGRLDPKMHMVMKGWLTKVGDKTFITCEELDPLAFLGLEEKPNPAGKKAALYFVGSLDLKEKDSQLVFRMLSGESDLLKKVESREALEKIVKEHLNDEKLYTDPMIFRRAGKDDADRIKAALKAFRLSPPDDK